jgi:hypothetical protein
MILLGKNREREREREREKSTDWSTYGVIPAS